MSGCDCWMTLDSLERDHYSNCDWLRREQRECGDCEPGLPCPEHRAGVWS